MNSYISAAAVAAFTLVSVPAFGQSADIDLSSTSIAGSQSQSQSGASLINQGDNVRVGTANPPSVNSTAPCVIGNSFGLGVAGFGIGGGTGRLDPECVTRQEAQILVEISNMRGEPRRAAITHFCINDESMRRSMIALGWCATQ